MSFYPDTPYNNVLEQNEDHNNFKRLLNKFEFSSNASHNNRNTVYQEPNQLLMRNYISKYTPYDSILLFSGLGTGKTCTSITIAEGLKEYVLNMGRRIVVLVKNKNIHKNFVHELLSQCTNNEYLTDAERSYYYNTVPDKIRKSPDFIDTRREIVNRVHRKLQQTFQFVTYGSFVNRTLGAKQFETDEYNRKTSKTKKNADNEIERKIIGDFIPNFSNTVVIVDEAHNVTNNDMYKALYNTLSRSFNYRLVLLTATPMYDNPKEIFELSNLLNVGNRSTNGPNLQLPIRNQLFKTGTYVVRESSSLINNDILSGGITRITQDGLNALSQTLYGKVSYLKPNTETNPSVNTIGSPLIPNRKGSSNVVLCEMSAYQFEVYKAALQLDLRSDSNDFVINNIVENDTLSSRVSSKASSLFKNSSDASTIAFPNNTFGKDGFKSLPEKQLHSTLHVDRLPEFSSKLFNIITNINASPGSAFVYSNYVNFGGTSLIKHLLLANGYAEFKTSASDVDFVGRRFIVFDESSSIETRERYRRIFNSTANKDGQLIKVIVGSPIMSEGITLKNVRQVHILEPCWNMSRINQIIGRAVRNYSHHDLPQHQRTVDVFKYVSVYKSSPDSFFIDKEKYILSEEKDRANKVVEKLLKNISFDCVLNTTRNFVDPSLAGSPECDYTVCEIKCSANPPDQNIDKFTYNQYISFFEKFDIDFLNNQIKALFKTFFIYHLDDIISALTSVAPLLAREVVFHSLDSFVHNKTPLEDAYGREGFLIVSGPFYIFNPSDLDVSSTLFAKMLDFSVDTNKYTLNQFAQNDLSINLLDDSESSPKSRRTKQDADSSSSLSPEDLKFNDDLVSSAKLFGTFRERGTVEYPYGIKDDKFRIVDLRGTKDSKDDKRKIISGMWVGSFNKSTLMDLVEYLEIPPSSRPPKLDKPSLGKLIQDFLIQKNLVLK